MVGFLSELAIEDESNNNETLKLKSSNELQQQYNSEVFPFIPEIDDLSLPCVDYFTDFDSIKNWIDEMQGTDTGVAASDVNIIENGVNFIQIDAVSSGVVELTKVVKDPETVGSVDRLIAVQEDGFREDNSVEKLLGVEPSMVRTEDLCGVNTEEAELGKVGTSIGMPNDGPSGEMKESIEEKPAVSAIKNKDGEKLGDLGGLIEERIGKVSLFCGLESSILQESGRKEIDNRHESDANSESGSDSSTSASSSTSSASREIEDNNGDGEEEDKDHKKEVIGELKAEGYEGINDLEEGEIMESDADKMVGWSDDNVNDVEVYGEEDDEGEGGEMRGPIRSKNELQVLPPVPPVNVTLQPSHQILPVGVVTSIIGAQVIVEGMEKHNPLNEGSVLWITERRLPLGIVDEIFGPVKNPYYVVRYNSESEVPGGVQQGTSVSFVPEFVDHVLNDKNLYQKGCDASGENDEEVLYEVEFSDDEKEAEYRRMLKLSKRENSDQKTGNKKKNRKNLKTRDRASKVSQPSASQTQVDSGSSLPNRIQQHMGGAPLISPNQQSYLSGFEPVFPAGPAGVSGFPQPSKVAGAGISGFPQPSQVAGAVVSGFPQPAQTVGAPHNGVWTHGIPCQQQNMVLPNGFQMNLTPWLQQNHLQAFQMPSVNPTPFQQQFALGQGLPSNNSLPLGATNLFPGVANSPWPGLPTPNISNQVPLGMGLQGQHPQGSQLPFFSGQGCNLQIPPNFIGNAGAPPQFNQGTSSSRGRKPFHGRGHFGSGRSRH
ncbi:hypothetical protein Ancab_007878 [Ancistrocladus abbreviatus]